MVRERSLIPSLGFARGALALTALGAALSCSGAAPSSEPEAEPLASVAELGARYPAVAPWFAEAALAPARPLSGAPGGGLLVTSAPRYKGREIAASSPAGPLASLSRAVTVEIAEEGGAVRVGVEGTGLSVGVRRIGAASNAGPTLEGGAVVVRGASPGVDALFFARERGVEELLRVSDRGANISYQIDLPPGYHLRKSDTLRGLIEVLDGAGVAWLRLRAEEGWDAAGRAVEVDAELEGDRVALEIAPDARYPVLVDPLWESTAWPLVQRDAHSATLLPTGKVLLAGGWGGVGKATLSSELFDPVTGTFTETGKTKREHAQHSATLLRQGRVLVAGGNNIEAGAEIYDPRAGQFGEQRNLIEPRFGHTATMLSNGDVLLAGGYLIGLTPTALSSAELFRADAVLFEATSGDLPAARGGHSAMLLPDHRVLLHGGENMPKSPVFTAYIYDPGAETFSPAGSSSVPGTNTATLLPSQEGLIVGNAVADLYASGAFTPLPGVPFIFDMKTSALLPTGQVFLSGNGTAPYLYDPNTQTFSPVADEPCNWDAATLLGNGTLLLTGKEACLYDPASSSIDPPTATAHKRVDFASVLLPTGKVLIAGGRESPGAPFAEIFDPAIDTFSIVPKLEHGFKEGSEVTRAVLLADGRVLLRWGADSAGGYVLYDAINDMAENRPWNGPVTTLLEDGSVLGFAGDEVYVYSPESASPVPIKPIEKTSETGAGHAEVRLPDGTVLIAGGASEQDDGRMELYHPKDGAIEILNAEVKGDLRGLVLPTGEALLAGAGQLAVYNPGQRALVPVALTTIPVFQEPPSLVLLPGGKVLLAGPTSADLSETRAVLYDPLTRRAGEPMIVPVPRLKAATLLPSGDVLLMGEDAWTQFRDTSVPAALDFTRPKLSAPSPSGAPGASEVTVTGSGFTGASEASSGVTNASPSNYPLALWMPIPVGVPQWGFLSDWTDTSATWSIPTTTYAGMGLLSIVTNGVRGEARPFIVRGAGAGTPCGANAACASLACVTGVCCGEACENGCNACSEAETGQPDGTCAPVLAGRDPRMACSGDFESACSPFKPTSPCEMVKIALSCSEGDACDGAGQCAPVPDGTACVLGLYCKGGECTDRCTSNKDCGERMVCSVKGRCSQPLNEGPSFASCAAVGAGRLGAWSGAGAVGFFGALMALAARAKKRRGRALDRRGG